MLCYALHSRLLWNVQIQYYQSGHINCVAMAMCRCRTTLSQWLNMNQLENQKVYGAMSRSIDPIIIFSYEDDDDRPTTALCHSAVWLFVF